MNSPIEQAPDMSPDEAQFRDDLDAPAFLTGKSQGLWRVVRICWPHVYVEILSIGNQKYTARFECDGYPSAPTALLWDPEQNCPSIPDTTHCTKKMQQLCTSLQAPDKQCFYLPCERRWEGHGNWSSQHPDQQWNPERGIASYLEVLRDALD